MNQKIKLGEGDEELLNSLKDIKTLYESEGGKLLADGLVQDIINKISVLSTNYGTLTHVEMIAVCASISEKLFLIRALTRADKNYKQLYSELLDEALRE